VHAASLAVRASPEHCHPTSWGTRPM
jgi:hypothetical protein